MGYDKPTDPRRDVGLWRWATAAALLFAAFHLVAASRGPFECGWLGHNGARYAQIARNHARLGLTHLHGAPLLDAGVPDQAHPDVYGHHPPALAWTIALVFRAAGVSESAAGAVPVVATCLLLLLFAWLVRAVAGPRAAAFAVLAAVAQPMLSVYGAHIDVQGSPVLLGSVATLAGYVHWRRGGRVAWMLAASALASAFDWYGLYMPVVCAAHLAWTAPRRRAAAVALALWAVSLFGAWLTWLCTLPGVTPTSVL
ncbi:MAG TPA: glycosyltransferase family 39 protein, partial [Planctomycetota bacterium]|nr:glycosyltransferase family 39 protein [Planctomycetota bacterium]